MKDHETLLVRCMTGEQSANRRSRNLRRGVACNTVTAVALALAVLVKQSQGILIVRSTALPTLSLVRLPRIGTVRDVICRVSTGNEEINAGHRPRRRSDTRRGSTGGLQCMAATRDTGFGFSGECVAATQHSTTYSTHGSSDKSGFHGSCCSMTSLSTTQNGLFGGGSRVKRSTARARRFFATDGSDVDPRDEDKNVEDAVRNDGDTGGFELEPLIELPVDGTLLQLFPVALIVILGGILTVWVQIEASRFDAGIAGQGGGGGENGVVVVKDLRERDTN